MTSSKAKKQARSLSYNAAAKRLAITEGKAVDVYAVEEFRDEDGTLLGCRLAKEGDAEAVYDVELSSGGCHCLGMLRWGRCRHLAAVRKLVECRLIQG